MDASTGEVRLADKEELRGIGITNITTSKSGKTTTLTLHTTDGESYQVQLQDGADGEDGKVGLTPQFSLEGTIFKWKFPNEESRNTLFDTESLKGKDGVSITAITKSKS
ncbi:MAG: hypothetical protein Q4B28_05020 [bacterium]|nr:hypothetical protein [bacterium]